MSTSPIKAEEGTADPKATAGYKSWKKKYRKMRITFDRKMHDGEELHKQEAKAAAMVKRLAIENDRLLDILLEINNSPQIPTDRRIDVSLEESDALSLPIDRDHAARKELAMKHLEQLLGDVPHLSYASAKDASAEYVPDLSAPDGEVYPAHFLSADDVDTYLRDIDSVIDSTGDLPSLARRTNPVIQQPVNPHLKNPTSVTNWLRKHAPKVFLQDGESHGHGGGGGAADAGGDDGDAAAGSSSRRKSKGGGAKAERGAGSSSKPTSKGKRTSIASKSHDKGGDWDASVDEDPDFGSTPVPKGKRKRDDDPGYRPKGGSGSRPTKKKRKSEGESTSSARKGKKESLSASRDD